MSTRTRAVVVGGSIAGLLAAAALATTYDEVLILERDRLGSGRDDVRPGLPQASHPHVLLLRGAQALEELLPGIRAEMQADGAPVFDMGVDLRVDMEGCSVPPRTTGLSLQTFRRTFLEQHVRARVLQLPGIRLRDATTVIGLHVGIDRTEITGVEVDTERSGGERIVADLVVDASGRTSQTPRWLTRLGFEAPRERTVDAQLGYTTAWLPGQAAPGADHRLHYELGQLTGHGRGGGFSEVDNQQTLLCFFGRGSERPPTDPDGLVAFATRLKSPVLIHAAATIDDRTPVHRYAHLPNRRRDYHRIRRWPERLLVIGDAHCVFNALYAQGMTVAALQALVLRRNAPALRDTPSRTQAVQRLLARRTTVPWLLATGQDARWARPDTLRSALTGRLMRHLMDRLPTNPHLYIGFLKVMQLLPPTDLLRPAAMAALLSPVPGSRFRPRQPARHQPVEERPAD
ncbi:FAD-dependent oxidoreductase [Streptomyces nojiriensis]|uniref:FAD-dependent oxidoreductase n=1 Tax=Streptomyces nojiriensis TaxID=66374 RepID=UPI0035DF0F5C